MRHTIKVLLPENENFQIMCVLGVFQTITKTWLSLTAMFQNDGGRFLNITNCKLLYAAVTTILHVVH